MVLARQVQGSVERLPGSRIEIYRDHYLFICCWPLTVEDADAGLEEVRRGDNTHQTVLLDNDNTLCSPFPQQPGSLVHRGRWRTSYQALRHDVLNRQMVE